MGEAARAAVTGLAQPGDNWMIQVAVELCKPGDMLVAGRTIDNADRMFGELLATSLKARGVVGARRNALKVAVRLTSPRNADAAS